MHQILFLLKNFFEFLWHVRVLQATIFDGNKDPEHGLPLLTDFLTHFTKGIDKPCQFQVWYHRAMRLTSRNRVPWLNWRWLRRGRVGLMELWFAMLFCPSWGQERCMFQTASEIKLKLLKFGSVCSTYLLKNRKIISLIL